MKKKILGTAQHWRQRATDTVGPPTYAIASDATVTANSSHNRNTLPSVVLCFDGKSPTLLFLYLFRTLTLCVVVVQPSTTLMVSSNLFKNVHHLSITFQRPFN